MNIYKKTSLILLVVFEATLIYTCFTAFIQMDYEVIKLSILGVFSILTPFIISFLAKKKKINLPLSFQLFGIVFIFTAQYFGEIKNFYDNIWWWDLMLHGAFGIYMVLTFLYFIKGIIRKEVEITHKRYVMITSLFAFSFTLSLGTLWEIFEFSGDFIFNTGMIKGGLEDTMSDIIIKASTAFVTSLIYYVRKRNE